MALDDSKRKIVAGILGRRLVVCTSRTFMTRRGLIGALALTFVLLPGISGADAQEQSIVIEGRVQWISGQRLVVAPVGTVIAPAGTSAINVDLSKVSQDEYSGLATGDAVQVAGTVTRARDRIVATSIRRLGPGSEGAASPR